MAEKIDKFKFFGAILYPESAPSDWLQKLRISGVPFALSPCHDKDVLSDGTPKKSHYHLLFSWNGPTTVRCVYKFMQELGQNEPVIVLRAPIGYYKYLTHQENPEKYRYNDDEVQTFNGFNLDGYDCLTVQDIEDYILMIEDMILSTETFEYWRVNQMLRALDDKYPLRVFRNNKQHFQYFLFSLRNDKIRRV